MRSASKIPFPLQKRKGGIAYLTTPFIPDELVVRVNAILKKRRSRVMVRAVYSTTLASAAPTVGQLGEAATRDTHLAQARAASHDRIFNKAILLLERASTNFPDDAGVLRLLVRSLIG